VNSGLAALEPTTVPADFSTHCITRSVAVEIGASKLIGQYILPTFSFQSHLKETSMISADQCGVLGVEWVLPPDSVLLFSWRQSYLAQADIDRPSPWWGRAGGVENSHPCRIPEVLRITRISRAYNRHCQ
jgi:hypothetical protein